MRNKIELKPPLISNVSVQEIFVNDKFYNAIVGINFDDKRGFYTKYRFITDRLHELIEPDEFPDRLFNSLKAEIINLDNEGLDKLLFGDKSRKIKW